ncbi:MAG: 2-oxoglutarate dehydrogenase complex dihydrolipoyllysine-residue succinyltransferase [Candidatus Hydrogenedentes bacterium]|nr:2-oxoglutarate dehydrogenase complex dihydrolipoyllysine-residue succinyltransferase [Candidatus Hydrogenedentota bacterium]
MAIELVVPEVGESITDVEIGEWLKAPGDYVERDEPIVEIESDKATVEVFAPVSGRVTEVLKKTGETAAVGELIGYMEEAEIPAPQPAGAGVQVAKVVGLESATEEPKPAPPAESGRVMPAAQRLLAQKGLSAESVTSTGPGGRLLKEDVQRHLESAPASSPPATASLAREEEVVRMTPMRRKISEILVNAQQTAALLTTFNEADLSAVMELRNRYKETYRKKYGIKLGFMSFFVKAAIDALKEIPQVNAEVRGTDIVYKNYFDIGIAVSGKKGLVVPILRNAERMSFAEIEMAISDFGARAQSNKITLEELKGGTFTISNGGTFGSLLSTPIVNPPQSGILGMHAIQQRPVVVDGQIVARPMMYLALTYDHRIVDGREAVTFLVRIKECIEDPSRILLEI